jgi:hypothetical protein
LLQGPQENGKGLTGLQFAAPKHTKWLQRSPRFEILITLQKTEAVRFTYRMEAGFEQELDRSMEHGLKITLVG